MVQRLFLPVITGCLLFLFSACREKEPERLPPDTVGGIRLGEKRIPRNGEGRRILLNEAVLHDDFRHAYGEVIPFDHRLCAIILIAPEVPGQGTTPEESVAKQLESRYLLRFQRTPAGLCAASGDVTVTVTRDFRFGPDAVAAEFRHLPLSLLAEEAGKSAEFQRIVKKNTALEKILVVEAALRDYYQDTGHYPATLAGLFRRPPLEPRWQGPYLERFSGQDPWGRDYVYFCFPDGKKYEFFSRGEDGHDFLR